MLQLLTSLFLSASGLIGMDTDALTPSGTQWSRGVAILPQDEAKESVQEEPKGEEGNVRSIVTLTISGGIELDFIVRGGSLNEASHWVPGGLAPGSPLNDGDTRIAAKFHLNLDIEIDSHWSGHIRIANQRINFDTFAVPDQTQALGANPESTRILVERAWVQGLDLFTEGTVLRAGVLDYAVAPAGAAPIFLDLGHAESPWGELPDSTLPFPAAGTNTVPQTRRDELQPTGLIFEFDASGVHGAILAFPAMLEGGSANADESLYGFHLWIPLDDGGSQLDAIVALMAGGEHEQQVFTIGLGGNYTFESLPLEIGAELYFQFGDAGSSLDHQAFAGRIRARLRFEWIWFELGFLYLSGDDDGLDDDEGRFLSYENNNTFLIAESSLVGFDIDNNIWSWRLLVGTTILKDDEGRGLDIELRIGGFRFVEEVPVSPDPFPGTVSREDDLGIEVDLLVRYPITSTLTVDAVVAVLFAADALESFTLDEENHAAAATVGITLRF